MIALPEKALRHSPLLLIGGVAILLALPVLINGCLDAHDMRHHLIWATYFSQQLWQGDFYPRWIQSMNAGLGSPTFFFYPPVAYYITSLFAPLFHHPAGCHALSLSSLVALVASGITAYLWLKDVTSPRAAAIASILYMAWPYHLAIDLYTRFAFAEYWCFVWMPLILYFSRRMVRHRPFGTLGLGLSLALLALTHLPSFMIFFPVPLGYVGFMADRQSWRRLGLRLGVAVALALGLSAIYWFPAIAMQPFVSMDNMTTGFYQYATKFLFVDPRHEVVNSFWKALELTTVLTGGLALCDWMLCQHSPHASIKQESHYWALVALGAIVMMLPISQLIWHYFPPIQKIQFPWRFNVVLTVASAALTALSRPQLKINFFKDLLHLGLSHPTGKRGLLVRIGSLVVIVLGLTAMHIVSLQGRWTFWGSRNTVFWLVLMALVLLNVASLQTPLNFSKQRLLTIGGLLIVIIFSGSLAYNDKFLARLEPDTLQRYLTVARGADEHRPRWFPQENFQEENLVQLGQDTPMVHLTSGQASWVIQRWHPRHLVLQVNAATPADLTLHQFYYPGWTVTLDGRSPHQPAQSSSLGLVQISVPPGNHQVAVTLAAGPEERTGQGISAVSLAVLLGAGARSRFTGHWPN